MRDPYTYLFTHPFVNIHRSPFDITKSTNSSIIDDSPKWSVTFKIILKSVPDPKISGLDFLSMQNQKSYLNDLRLLR